MKWINTVEAVTAADGSQWRVGDAIEKDRKSANTALPIDFGECAEVLSQKGYKKYNRGYLRKLYKTAVAFTRDERDERYSWDVHYQTGTPANLKQATTALRKIDKTITLPSVTWLMAEWREKARKERLQEHARAKAEEERAAKRQAAAAAKALAAKTAEEKRLASLEHQKAKQERRDARDQAKATKSAPTYNADVETELQDPGTLAAIAIYMGVTANALTMKRLAKKYIEELNQIAEYLTPAQAAEITSSYSEVIQLTQAIINKAKGKPGLKVHEGGAA